MILDGAAIARILELLGTADRMSYRVADGRRLSLRRLSRCHPGTP